MQIRNSQDGLANDSGSRLHKNFVIFTTLELHVGFYYCLFFAREALVVQVLKLVTWAWHVAQVAYTLGSLPR